MPTANGGTAVKVAKVIEDPSPLKQVYDPKHPMADEKGYVKYPNVNSLIETMDMREAQRTYEANLNVVTVTRQMLGSTINILRG